MKEHEQLKEICDKIWYIALWHRYIENCWYVRDLHFTMDWPPESNVREIIFTQEFMDKYFNYLINNTSWWDDTLNEIASDLIFQNLNNPVQYLFDLIK